MQDKGKSEHGHIGGIHCLSEKLFTLLRALGIDIHCEKEIMKPK